MSSRLSSLRLVSLLSLSVLLGACSSGGALVTTEAGGTGTAPASATEGVTAFLADVLSDRPRLSAPDVEARLGPPVRVHRAAKEGDSLRTMIYYGLEVTLHDGPAGATVARLALTDARHVSPEGLRVGHAESYVLRTLGRPTRQTPTRYFYEQAGPPPLVLTVTFEQRAISQIEWQLMGE